MPAINITDLINAQLDVNTIAGVATSTAPTVTDRLGNLKNTLSGMNAAVLASAAAVQGSIGYLPPVAYASAISLTLAAQTVSYTGQTYAPLLSALPFTTSGTFETARFRLIQGVAGADLAAPNGSVLVGNTDPLATTVNRAIRRLPGRQGRASSADLPRFMATINNYRHDLQTAIPIVGVGSSVGVGATLVYPLADAPVAYFAAQLKAQFDPAGLYNFAVSNQSVNGSVIAAFPTAWAAILALGYTTPGIVVFAYGMNDQQPAAYNAGQTFPGFSQLLRSALATVRSAGWDAVVLTTPHASISRFPDTLSMPAGVPQSYPTFVAANVSDAALQPTPSQAAMSADFLGDGTVITASHRAFRVNQSQRIVARRSTVAVIDAERYWLEALQKYLLIGGSMIVAEGFLFDANEKVHPNLLGHQLSYQRAIREFIQGFAAQTGQPALEPTATGRFGINADTPSAALEVRPAYAETGPAISVFASTGQANGDGMRAQGLAFQIEQATGDVVSYINTTNNNTPVPIEYSRLHARMDGSGTVVASVEKTTTIFGPQQIKDTQEVNYNLGAGVQSPFVTFPANSFGTLTVDGFQNGIGRQRNAVDWVSNGGGVIFGAVRNVQSGGPVFTGPTASGLTPQVTNAASGTALSWRMESRT